MKTQDDYLLEKLAYDELSPAQADTLRDRIAAQGGDVQARLAQLRASDAEILERLPAPGVMREIQRRAQAQAAVATARTQARSRHWLAGMTLATAAAGAVLLFVGVGKEGRVVDDQGEYTGIKGLMPHLVVYRQENGESTRLTRADRARPGDLIQLAYVVRSNETGPKSGPKYGVIASVDDAGHVSLHLPEEPGPAVSLQIHSGETQLPHAFELDATPGKERFVFVVGRTPFDAQRVQQALSERSPMPTGTLVSEFTLIKELTR